MTKPWEKYNKTKSSGPWDKYGSSREEATPEIKPELEYSTIEALGMGADQGITLGFADELNAMLSGLPEAKGGVKKAASFLPGVDYSDDPDVAKYKETVGKERERYSTAKEESPWAFGGGEVVGSIPTMLIPGLQAAKVAKGASLGQKMLAGSKVGARFGATFGAGASEAETGGELIKDVGAGAAIGTALGPVAELGIRGAGKGLELASKAAKKVADLPVMKSIGTKIGGVKEKSWDIMRKDKAGVKVAGKGLADASDEGVLPILSENIRRHKADIIDAETNLAHAQRKAELSLGTEQDVAKQEVNKLQDYLKNLQSEKSAAGAQAGREFTADLAEDTWQAKQRLKEIRDQGTTLKAAAFSENAELAETATRQLPELSIVAADAGKHVLLNEPLQGFSKQGLMAKVREMTLGRLEQRGMQDVRDETYKIMEAAYKSLDDFIKTLPDDLTEVQAKAALDRLRQNLKTLYNAKQQGAWVGSLDLPEDKIYNAAAKEIRELLRTSNPAYSSYAEESSYLIGLHQASLKKLGKDYDSITRGVGRASKDPQSGAAQVLEGMGAEQKPTSLPANLQQEASRLETQVAGVTPAAKVEGKLRAKIGAEAPYETQIVHAEEGVQSALRNSEKLNDTWMQKELQHALRDETSISTFAKDKASAIQAWFPDKAGRSRAAELLQEALEKNDDTALAALRSMGEDMGPNFQREIDLLGAFMDFHKKGGQGAVANAMGLAGRAVGSTVGTPFGGYLAGKGAGSMLGAGRSLIGRTAFAAESGHQATFSIISKAIKFTPEKLGPYADQLVQASQRGVLPITHYKLMQNDPEYRKIQYKLGDEEE